MSRPRRPILALLGPGLLVAATGVGAGDLATAGFAGSRLGPAILWAVVLGAALKLVLNEGLARHQLVTGRTLLAGAVTRLGWPAVAVFAVYLLPWTFFTAAALMSACGVAAHGLVPVLDDARQAKVVFGIAHAIAGYALVRAGGFVLFERIMAACIAVMFATVLVTAARLAPDAATIARGLLWPTIPDLDGDGLTWTVALTGGVGGTVTVLCYGYWIREQGRATTADLRACRIDLAVAYACTALFGIAMIVIARGTTIEGGGATLIVDLADQLGTTLGPWARGMFLVGAWAAIFSSLLGVWQAVPYLVADFTALARGRGETPPSTRAPTYVAAQIALATVPMLGLVIGFERIQRSYAVVGASFIPMLAFVLLVLNRRRALGAAHGNGPVTTAALVAALALFGLAAAFTLRRVIAA